MNWIKIREGKVEQFRENLHSSYLPIYDSICKSLPISWAPYYGFRTIEQQLALYEKGRSKESIAKGERIVTKAAPGLSMHNYGMATDWTIWDFHGKPVWDHNEWQLYRNAIKVARGDWAGNWITFKEMYHNQYPTRAGMRRVNEIRIQTGIDAAIEYILGNPK